MGLSLGRAGRVTVMAGRGARVYPGFASYRLVVCPFLAGRATPSMPDLAAYPQFALFYVAGFRGGDDILREPALMSWLRRMTPFVSGVPPLIPEHVRRKNLPR